MLKVFYNDRQSVKNNNSFSPSAGKPALIAAEFAKSPRVQLVDEFDPLSAEELSVAHDPEHVAAVLRCEKVNGFGSTSPEIARSLPWVHGSFYAAACYALENETFTMSPTSGFHHAGYDSTEGFCTFNGLMVTAMLLKDRGMVDNPVIVDFDCHYGNGTDDIIRKFGIDWIEHYTFGEFAEEVSKTIGFEVWLSMLPRVLSDRMEGADLVLYQAGADPHVDDPFGGYLTTVQMQRRDRVVFQTAKALGLPLVWNLAGGYQSPVDKVITLHKNTLTECLRCL